MLSTIRRLPGKARDRLASIPLFIRALLFSGLLSYNIGAIMNLTVMYANGGKMPFAYLRKDFFAIDPRYDCPKEYAVCGYPFEGKRHTPLRDDTALPILADRIALVFPDLLRELPEGMRSHMRGALVDRLPISGQHGIVSIGDLFLFASIPLLVLSFCATILLVPIRLYRIVRSRLR